MKFTVTPLGGGRANAARVVDSIVRYLQPQATRGQDAVSAGSGPERYYADRGEEPGRWLGRTARSLGLTGAAQREDFAAVLGGRDPHTDGRLIAAQGSAGRRSTLGAGAHTRVAADGEALYGVADAAAALGLARAEVERMLDVGAAVAVAGVAQRVGPAGPFGPPVRPPAGSPVPDEPPAGHPAGRPVGRPVRLPGHGHPHQTPELTTSHRLQHPDDRAAAEALRDGRIDEAFDRLASAGHLTRQQLNRLAHLLRRVHGELGNQSVDASGDRTFAVRDRVTARAPNRELHVEGDRHAYVRNGALGTIVAIQADPHDRARDTLVVEFDGIGGIDIPRSFFDHHPARGGQSEVGIDHAYALTSYAVQGSTRDVSTSRVDATATRAETYVDITRGRHANHLYLTTATDPLDGETLPRVSPAPADVAVAERLHRSTGELTA